MVGLALRGMRARPVRVALTALAVVLGAAMIAGAYVLTDTIHRAVAEIFSASAHGADAVVTGRSSSSDSSPEAPSIPQAVVDKVNALPGVAQSEGQVRDSAALVGADGQIVQVDGAPTLAVSFLNSPFQTLRVTRGRAPVSPDELAVDEHTASARHLRLGQSVRLSTAGPARMFTVVGSVGFGDTSLGGATLVVLDLGTAQALFHKRGLVDSLYVRVLPGVRPDEVVREIGSVLPRGLQVRRRADQVRGDIARVSGQLSFLTSALLALALVALVVGGLVIYNAFSITVAQRTRELALLRMLGATRRQVLTSVVIEAVAIGLVASTVGLGLGFLAAEAIRALLLAAGIDLPTTAAVLRPRTVAVSLGVGTLVTLAASLHPALRAARVAPMAALPAPDALTGDRRSRLAPLTRAVTAAVRVAGWPAERTTSLVGRLARENAARNPGRTAATAASLMVGLAVAVSITVLANGARISVRQLVDHGFAGDLAVVHQDGSSPIPVQTAQAVASVSGVQSTSVLKRSDSQVRGAGRQSAYGIDPTTVESVYRFDWVEGSDEVLGLLGPSGALVEQRLADHEHLHVGSPFEVTTPAGIPVTLHVRGVYRDRALLTGYALGLPAFTDTFHQSRAAQVFVKLLPDANRVQALRAVNTALAPYPQARARSQRELADEQASRVDSILYLLYAMLALSLVVSLLGIVNALTLSTYERSHELGVLRAVGLSRRQSRRTVRYEAVITTMIGAMLGVILGLLVATAVAVSVGSDGLVLAVPWGQIAGLMALALALGWVGAAVPARRAGRLDVLGALAYE